LPTWRLSKLKKNSDKYEFLEIPFIGILLRDICNKIYINMPLETQITRRIADSSTPFVSLPENIMSSLHLLVTKTSLKLSGLIHS